MKLMYRTLFLSLFLLISACTTSSENDETEVYLFDFSNSTEEWTAGFADYPVGEEESYKLSVNWVSLPTPLDTAQKAFRISGENRSDDLFMFIKRKIEGLKPSASYSLKMEVQLASNSPEDAVGIGGGPGTSVYLKAGATDIEPKPVVTEQAGFDNGYYRMNIDRGNQAQGGEDMPVIGNVAHENDDFEYTLINRSLQNFTVQTDSNGGLWLVIGTDSGFEGETTLYYTEIRVELREL